jgi:ABC-type Fe3+ transport system permease subunit
MVTTVTPYKTAVPPSFRRRYFGFWKVVLVVVVVLQIPAWMFIYHRTQPLPVTQPGTNKQYSLSQTDEAWYTEPLGTPIPIAHTASLVRGFTPSSLAHVSVQGSNRLQFVFPKGANVCVSVPSVVYGTEAVPKVVPC